MQILAWVPQPWIFQDSPLSRVPVYIYLFGSCAAVLTIHWHSVGIELSDYWGWSLSLKAIGSRCCFVGIILHAI